MADQPNRPAPGHILEPNWPNGPITPSVRAALERTEGRLSARIASRPDVLGGKSVIRGTRLAVEHILGMLAAGDAPGELLVAYPGLVREDILACLEYAGRQCGTRPLLQRAVEVLNEALKLSPVAVSELMLHRVLCSGELLAHPVLVVRDETGGRCSLGVLGLLNSILDPGRNAPGPVAMTTEGDDKVIGFHLLGPT